MRLCRFSSGGKVQAGLYFDEFVVPFSAAGALKIEGLAGDDLLDYLPPDGKHFAAAKKFADAVASNTNALPANVRLPHDSVELLVPVPRPSKLLLLAGNYNEHLTEGGGAATERSETFPYVFTKPPTTTLTASGKPVVIPKVSPDHIDWELELGIVIGRRGAAFTIAHDNYTGGDILDKMRSANREVLVIAQIETARGVENVDEIAAIEGIDVLWIGHFDLSNFLGVPGEFNHPRFLEAVDRVAGACWRHNKAGGFLVGSPEEAQQRLQQGFRCLAYGGDLWMYQQTLGSGLRSVRQTFGTNE